MITKEYKNEKIYIDDNGYIINYDTLNKLFNINLTNSVKLDDLKTMFPNMTTLHEFVDEICNEKQSLSVDGGKKNKVDKELKISILSILTKRTNLLICFTLFLIIILLLSFIRCFNKNDV